MSDRRIVFTSSGLWMPEGQYLVTVWADGVAELSWREAPDRSIVWSPGIEGETPDE